ncbi:MAG: ABC transporter ATP-binding protein [Anaerolineae bacterium]|nr:ABC transporter ATP-binding protein [Anaerolineae bacterium]
MEIVIKAENLTKRFGDFTAVNSVSFSVQKGEILGYLGPNGSGKTTTIRMLLGLLTPSAGSIEVLGINVQQNPEPVRQQVGYMSQKFSLYHDMTVEENLAFYAGVYGIVNRQRINAVLEEIGLTEVKRSLVQNLSTGWRQRLALATSIIHQPPLLFLDEPTGGVDPAARRAFWDLIYQQVEQGVTALVTTHYMDEAEYCTRVGIMQSGRLLALDTPQGLKKSMASTTIWDIHATPLLPTLTRLEKHPNILLVRLASDHLSVITAKDMDKKSLEHIIEQGNSKCVQIEEAEPSLEDVFLTLAGNN